MPRKPPIPFRLQPDAWGLLVLCLLIGIVLSGPRLGPLIGLVLVVSLLLHEAGHILMAAALGVPVKEFGLSLFGAYIRRAYATSRHDEILIALAGPLASLALAGLLLPIPGIAHRMGLCNMAIGLINLVPIPASDGLRILRTLRNPNAPGPVSAPLPGSQPN